MPIPLLMNALKKVSPYHQSRGEKEQEAFQTAAGQMPDAIGAHPSMTDDQKAMAMYNFMQQKQALEMAGQQDWTQPSGAMLQMLANPSMLAPQAPQAAPSGQMQLMNFLQGNLGDKTVNPEGSSLPDLFREYDRNPNAAAMELYDPDRANAVSARDAQEDERTKVRLRQMIESGLNHRASLERAQKEGADLARLKLDKDKAFKQAWGKIQAEELRDESKKLRKYGGIINIADRLGQFEHLDQIYGQSVEPEALGGNFAKYKGPHQDMLLLRNKLSETLTVDMFEFFKGNLNDAEVRIAKDAATVLRDFRASPELVKQALLDIQASNYEAIRNHFDIVSGLRTDKDGT